MKPFDFEKAKAGDPICTRTGLIVKFIAHVPDAERRQRVVWMDLDGDIKTCDDRGRFAFNQESSRLDLFMAPKKHKLEVYVNLYEDGTTGDRWWESSSKADDYAFPAIAKKRLGGKAARAVIEWEE